MNPLGYLRKAFVLSLFVATLPGCSTMQTETAALGDSAPGKPKVGNYYFLPRGMIRVAGQPDKDKGYVVVISRFNVPDVNARYFLQQNMNPFYDDHTTLEVDEQGLLTTTNVDSEDKTPAILDKVTETVINVAKISANLGGSPLALSDIRNETSDPKPFNCTFDPLERTQVNEAKRKVSAAGFLLHVEDTGGSGKKVAPPADSSPSNRGVFYRPPRVVNITITAKSALKSPVLEKTVVRVPDPSQTAVLSLSRPFLVKKTTNLTFAAGDLKKVEFKKASEALAVVSIPASITAKVAEAIPSIIEIQDSRANSALAAEKASLEAQKGVLDAQLQLAQSRKALDDFQAGGGNNAAASAAQGVGASGRTFLSREEKVARAEAALMEAEATKKEAELRKRNAEAALLKPPQ